MSALFPAQIDRLSAARILVIGDAMLDIYTSGISTRQSPEAPVPVITVQDRHIVLGGAANVAANLAALGAHVELVCLTGQDANRDVLIAQAQQAGIKIHGLIADASRPTIVKERLSMNGAPYARVDDERTHDLDGAALAAFNALTDQAIGAVQVIILSDYCKGLLPDGVVRALIQKARQHNIPVLVDSKKKDFSVFAGAALIKPNAPELAERSRTASSDVTIMARALMEQSGIDAILASRSEEGVVLVTKEQAYTHPATARHVGEVSGAGDTLLSVCAAALATGACLADAVCLGNIAAGIAVEKSGTSIVRREELTDAVLRYNRNTKNT